MKLVFKRLHSDATLPTRATPGSVGYDLAVCQDVVVPWNGHALLSTGVALARAVVADSYADWTKAHELQLRPRSSLFPKWRLIIPNSPGTIDPDYRGEIRVSVLHVPTADTEITWAPGSVQRAVVIPAGTKVAQLVVAAAYLPEPGWAAEHDLGDPSERGVGGFGSTGV